MIMSAIHLPLRYPSILDHFEKGLQLLLQFCELGASCIDNVNTKLFHNRGQRVLTVSVDLCVNSFHLCFEVLYELQQLRRFLP